MIVRLTKNSFQRIIFVGLIKIDIPKIYEKSKWEFNLL